MELNLGTLSIENQLGTALNLLYLYRELNPDMFWEHEYDFGDTDK